MASPLDTSPVVGAADEGAGHRIAHGHRHRARHRGGSRLGRRAHDDVETFDQPQREPVRRQNLAHERDGIVRGGRRLHRQRRCEHGRAIGERHAGGAQLVDDDANRATNGRVRQPLGGALAECAVRRDAEQHGREQRTVHGADTTMASSRIS